MEPLVDIDVRLIFAILNGKVSAAISRKLLHNFHAAGLDLTPEQWNVLQHLKQRDGGVCVVAVEPETSNVLSGGAAGPHPLEGIGAGFVPGALDTSIYDRVELVSGEQAYAAARELARTEGLLCGVSSGAALHAARKLAAEPRFAGKNIVAILPDTGERYLSTPLWALE